MSQVKAGLEEPKHFLGRNLDDMLDHGPSNPTWPRGGCGGDRGERNLNLLKGEGSRWVRYGPGGEGAISSWGPMKGLWEEGSCKQLRSMLGSVCKAIRSLL